MRSHNSSREENGSSKHGPSSMSGNERTLPHEERVETWKAELDKGEGPVENSNEGNVELSEGGGNVDISEGGGNVDMSEGGGNVDMSEGGGNVVMSERGEVHEPYVGLEFDSEDEARKFYFDYARRVGFVVRMMQRRISETDKKVIARRLGCNKQGFSPNYGTIGPDNKPRPSAREGCRATILVKLEKSGKWVVSRFEKEHNHPLVVTEQGPSTTGGDKDKKIEFLIRELRRQDQLCAAYREKLLKFLTSIEEQTDQLSSKIQDVVDNVRKFEAEVQQQLPQHR